MILLIDNYDSFVHNLARYFRLLGLDVCVARNDKLTTEQVQADVSSGRFRCIVLSPGPCSPFEAGICLSLVSRLYREVPFLGICLGHQAIAQALGGDVVVGSSPQHGRADQIYHDQRCDFQDLPNPLLAGRYHSLIVREDTLPSFFDVSARLSDETIMGIRHKRLPIVGYQFHPESILTPHGLSLLHGFCRWIGLPVRLPDSEASARNPARPRELEVDYPQGCRPLTEVDATVPRYAGVEGQ
ncbi:MAG: aminodeoxychorismate/anthranilate synthase component II [Planctomycetaceae bacterium]|nr:aminodeoxychorismate/anthranilate synthase component II [Planctomycetaceae bacterium]